MRLLQKLEVSRKAIFAFPLFDLILHGSHVRGELEHLPIAKPDVVVWIAFHEVYSFGFEGGVQIFKGLMKEAREEKERRTLVESLVEGQSNVCVEGTNSIPIHHDVSANIFHR